MRTDQWPVGPNVAISILAEHTLRSSTYSPRHAPEPTSNKQFIAHPHSPRFNATVSVCSSSTSSPSFSEGSSLVPRCPCAPHLPLGHHTEVVESGVAVLDRTQPGAEIEPGRWWKTFFLAAPVTRWDACSISNLVKVLPRSRPLPLAVHRLIVADYFARVKIVPAPSRPNRDSLINESDNSAIQNRRETSVQGNRSSEQIQRFVDACRRVAVSTSPKQ